MIALRRIDLFLVVLFNFIPIIYFHGAFLANRARVFTYFTAGNPIIKYWGILETNQQDLLV